MFFISCRKGNYFHDFLFACLEDVQKVDKSICHKMMSPLFKLMHLHNFKIKYCFRGVKGNHNGNIMKLSGMKSDLKTTIYNEKDIFMLSIHVGVLNTCFLQNLNSY